MANVIVRPRARVFHGHDWVHDNEVLKVTGNPEDGSVVGLKDQRDRFVGSAIYNSRSKIPARRFSRQRQDLDGDFFARRIAMASEYRDKLGLDPRARREVWSESDGLPGVILDRYGDCVVMQTLTLAMDRRKDLIADALEAILKPTCIIERNDAPVRKAEGLELTTSILRGKAPGPFEVPLGGINFGIDLPGGQKTGLYLDQADNYALVAQLAKGKRVLDCFSNQGGFALASALAGASEVTALDISADACATIEANAKRNNVRLNVTEANVFDWLKTAVSRGEAYDLIILDPPSFTRDRARLNDALRGYKEIHLRAAQLLGNGGLLATFCCSHHVSDAIFLDVIRDAMVDARKTARLRASYTQRADHPVILGIPESSYLKGHLLEMAPGR
ncbi:MAG: class I SAM-dependent rRNA methyltransferase [Chthoniobacterales bacterium]|nr:class I SAM-dependent rRNA methyltransferase [Chthoniobacterales bacterium]